MTEYVVQPTGMVERASDGALVPPAPENRDYQLMLAELASGEATLASDVPADPRAQATSDAIQQAVGGG